MSSCAGFAVAVFVVCCYFHVALAMLRKKPMTVAERSCKFQESHRTPEDMRLIGDHVVAAS